MVRCARAIDSTTARRTPSRPPYRSATPMNTRTTCGSPSPCVSPRATQRRSTRTRGTWSRTATASSSAHARRVETATASRTRTRGTTPCRGASQPRRQTLSGETTVTKETEQRVRGNEARRRGRGRAPSACSGQLERQWVFLGPRHSRSQKSFPWGTHSRHDRDSKEEQDK